MRYPLVTKYSATKMGAQYSAVMPAKPVPAIFRRGADIQAFLLDSRQSLSPQALGGEHAGMTSWGNRHFILWWFIKRCRVLITGLTLFCLCLAVGVQCPALAGQQPAAAEKIQESVIAGSWYPGTEAALRREVEGFLAQVPPMDPAGQLVALISPHAGYRFSGKVAAYAYKLLEQQKFSTVVIIAPSHHARFPGVSVYDQGGFRTPLGVVELDRELIAALKERDSRIRYFPEAYTKEHSLEIQLPFLQVVMPGFKLVPLVMGEQNLAACEGLAEAVAGAIRGKSVLVVASSDLSHFHSSQQAKALDQVVLDRVNGFDAHGSAPESGRGALRSLRRRRHGQRNAGGASSGGQWQPGAVYREFRGCHGRPRQCGRLHGCGVVEELRGKSPQPPFAKGGQG